jgi:hypothetical protein
LTTDFGPFFLGIVLCITKSSLNIIVIISATSLLDFEKF